VGFHDGMVWACDFGSGLYRPRSDFSHDGSSISAVDLSFFVSVWAQKRSALTGTRCDTVASTSPLAIAEDGGLNLAWTDCLGGGGVSTRTFACNTNTARLMLAASFVAPSSPVIDSLVAWEAVLDIVAAPGTSLPLWWRVERDGCRYGAVHDTTTSGTCEAIPRGGFSGGAQFIEFPSVTDGVARYYVADFFPRAALEPGVEYELFRMVLNTWKTVGPGSCAGCSTPVLLMLESVTLWEGQGCGDANPLAGRRVMLTRPATDSHAWWQSTIAAVGEPKEAAGAPLWLADKNPSRGRITVGLVLTSGRRAQLDVLDVTGRQVHAQPLEGLGPGAHVVTLGEHGGLAPGVYFARFIQGERRATVRFVILR
jgi:hypothetical protein